MDGVTESDVEIQEAEILGESNKRKRFSWESRGPSKRRSKRHSGLEEEYELDNYSVWDVDAGLDPLFDTSDDAFQEEVVSKTREYLIGKQEAEVRVMIDRIVQAKGTVDRALLFVLSYESLSVHKIGLFTTILLHRGANPSVCDSNLQTPLHYAAKRDLIDVCRRLLENDALPDVVDKNKVRPLTLAVENSNDQIASLLLDYISNKDVRSLFLADGDTPAEFNCRTLLDKDMEETMMSLLNCMVDRYGSSREAKVYYSLLESDCIGRTPSHPRFDKTCKSVLFHIAKSGNKTIIYHEAVRLLIRKKWKDHMRSRFLISAFIYLFTTFSMIYSAVVASSVADPMLYNTPLQISRAVFEIIAYLMVFVVFLLELNQFRRHKLQYWFDMFNWLDISSTTLLLIVLPLRLTHTQAQWHVFSVGYILWAFRIFKFSVVFRQTGAYSQILWRVLSYDIVQFLMFFGIILVAFSGAFLLALRGENSLDAHWETSTFWWILFSGFRTLIDGEPLVETYIELPPLSVILVIVFMFLCIVVMLNLLIAQLSDTYQNIQSDAQRGLELSRAWIVTRMEMNSLFMGNQRIKHYIEMEEFRDFQDVLAKWDSPPLNSIHTKLRTLEELMDLTHDTQTKLLQRLAWQEKALVDIQSRLPDKPSTGATHSGTDEEVRS